MRKKKWPDRRAREYNRQKRAYDCIKTVQVAPWIVDPWEHNAYAGYMRVGYPYDLFDQHLSGLWWFQEKD